MRDSDARYTAELLIIITLDGSITIKAVFYPDAHRIKYVYN